MRALGTLFLACGALLAQGGLSPTKLGAPPTDTWPTYNGDYSGRRYSPLSKINQGNINSLSLAFVYRANGALGGGPSRRTHLFDTGGGQRRSVLHHAGSRVGGGRAYRP